ETLRARNPENFLADQTTRPKKPVQIHIKHHHSFWLTNFLVWFFGLGVCFGFLFLFFVCFVFFGLFLFVSFLSFSFLFLFVSFFFVLSSCFRSQGHSSYRKT